MKRTKIICTLGPASNNRETLKALMENGMDIARFNFSHGDHEEQKGRVDMIKELREELDIPIAMLLDTKGPEIRTRLLKDGQKVKLEAGKQFVLGIGDFEGDDKKVAFFLAHNGGTAFKINRRVEGDAGSTFMKILYHEITSRIFKM